MSAHVPATLNSLNPFYNYYPSHTERAAEIVNSPFYAGVQPIPGTPPRVASDQSIDFDSRRPGSPINLQALVAAVQAEESIEKRSTTPEPKDSLGPEINPALATPIRGRQSVDLWLSQLQVDEDFTQQPQAEEITAAMQHEVWQPDAIEDHRPFSRQDVVLAKRASDAAIFEASGQLPEDPIYPRVAENTFGADRVRRMMRDSEEGMRNEVMRSNRGYLPPSFTGAQAVFYAGGAVLAQQQPQSVTIQRLIQAQTRLDTVFSQARRYSEELIARHTFGMMGRPSNTSEISGDPSVEQLRIFSPDHQYPNVYDVDDSFSLGDVAQNFLSLAQYLSPRESYDSRISNGSAEDSRDGYSPPPVNYGAPRYSVESDDASGFYDRPPSYDEVVANDRLDRLNRQIAEAENRLARLSAASSDSIVYV